MCLVSEFCVQYSCKHQISRSQQEINSGKVDSSPEYQVKEYGLYSEEWLMVDKIGFALFFCILSRYFMNQDANTKKRGAQHSWQMLAYLLMEKEVYNSQY